MFEMLLLVYKEILIVVFTNLGKLKRIEDATGLDISCRETKHILWGGS